MLALAAVAAVFALAACTEDTNPDGGWSSPVQGDQFLYLGNKDGEMVRVSANNGLLDVPWRFPGTDDVGEFYGDPVLVDGVVYGAGYKCTGNNCEGQIFAVTEETGISAWAAGAYEVNTKLVGTVALGDGVLVAGASAVNEEPDPPGFLLALDPRADTGLPAEEQVGAREKWRLEVDGAVWSSPAVADNVAYFGTMDGTVYAVDLADRPEYESDVNARVLWTFSVGGAVAGPVLFENGKLYFGSFDSKVYALDIAARAQNREGTELVPSSEWSFDTGNWVWAKPLSHEGVLYVSNLGGWVYALDLETGQTVWPAPAEIGGQILGQPAVINSSRGPSLAVPSGDEDVFIVVIANGQVAGRFDTSGNGVKSNPALVGERLFVHSVNGQLRVFDTGSLRQEVCIEPRGDGRQC